MRLPRLLSATLLLAACGDNLAPAADAGDVDGPPTDAPTGDVPRVEAAACRFDVPVQLGTEGTDYECGDLVVFENREARGRVIRLHYARFESAAVSNNATVYLDGGPGGGADNIIAYAGFLGAPFLDGLRVDGDFLVLGQRGAARSKPFLDCQEPNCADFPANDLSAYNTANNADDVDDLRAALGYEKLNLYGISYGSRLGLEVLRRHGDKVRAAVIEGLVPAQVAWPAAVPASFYSALTALDQSCTAAGACGTAWGNLRTKFSSGAASLANDPLPIMLFGAPFDLDAGTYSYLLFQMLYSKGSYPWLPLFISDVNARRTDRVNDFLAQVVGGGGGGGPGISMGLYYSVVCSEIFNPPDPDAFATLNAGVPADVVSLMGNSWFGLMDTCAAWPRASTSHQTALAQPVTSAVRTLVSSGSLDPITPPTFGAIAAATLSNSEVVVHANSGHGATLQSTCGTANLGAFLADPAATHDFSCAAAITTDYVLPAQTRAIPGERIRAEMKLAPLPPMMQKRLDEKLRR